ncbi:hypothetical protein BJX66DRAFT_339092 [Aspergillus keveii]|uniref:Uncharacterized protein n=1 Tax=Aspergillus keveii TaxID=714993 RepID=A0ABR4G2E4_9EURO
MASRNPSTSYSITILNRSSVSKSYAIFTHVPAITPTAQGLTSHAILVAKGVAPKSGTAYFSIPRESYFAVCGTSHQDEATKTHILDRRPVTLGAVETSVLRPGTTCVTQVVSDALSFALWDGPAGDRGEAGAFCIQTGLDFTYEEATTNNFILGLGLSTTGSAQVGLYASFIPTPRTTYQITPSKLFYIVPRQLSVNAPRNDEDFANACQVDFLVRSAHVKLAHNDNNVIEVVDDDSSSSILAPKL